jgi:hypothetical protein
LTSHQTCFLCCRMPTPKANVKEAVIERELVVRVRISGGLCIKLASPGRRGMFDRLVILPGPRVIFIELKRPKGGRISPHQQLYAARFKSLGVAIAVVRSSADIDLLLRDNPQK